MKNKKKNIDDDNGVSILSTRLKGEQLDDDMINELMASEKEEKKSKEINTKEPNNINDGSVVNSDTGTCQTEEQDQSLKDNKVHEPDDIKEEGNPEHVLSKFQDNKTPVRTDYIPTGQPTIQPMVQQINPGMQQYIGYSVVSQPIAYSPAAQQPIIQQPVIQQQAYGNEIYTDNVDNQGIQSKACIQTPRKRISTRGRRTTGRRIFDAIIYKIIGLAVIAAVVFLLSKYVFGMVKLDNEYMFPTYDKGEMLITEKLSRYFGSYKSNDIVVVEKADKVFAARIIGCPGDTIYINEDGSIYINGEVFEELEELDIIADAGAAGEEIKLGSKEFFVLSDNRNNGFDSRNTSVGVIKKSEIYGSVLFNINFDD